MLKKIGKSKAALTIERNLKKSNTLNMNRINNQHARFTDLRKDYKAETISLSPIYPNTPLAIELIYGKQIVKETDFILLVKQIRTK